MSVTSVIGLQWGDEAKGKIVDLMTPDFDIVVRYQGGANAGHTVVVGDDVYKLQGEYYYYPDRRITGIRSRHFALRGGDSYTMRWSIYLSRDGSYWDFINQVRADWPACHRVDGPFVFTYPRSVLGPPKERLKEQIETSGVKYIIFWFNPSSNNRDLEAPYAVDGPARLAESVREKRLNYPSG